jgi:hypothetical protein
MRTDRLEEQNANQWKEIWWTVNGFESKSNGFNGAGIQQNQSEEQVRCCARLFSAWPELSWMSELRPGGSIAETQNLFLSQKLKLWRWTDSRIEVSA